MRLLHAALAACMIWLAAADGLTASSLASSKSIVDVREGETESLALQLTHELGANEDVVLRVIVPPTSAFTVEPLRERSAARHGWRASSSCCRSVGPWLAAANLVEGTAPGVYRRGHRPWRRLHFCAQFVKSPRRHSRRWRGPRARSYRAAPANAACSARLPSAVRSQGDSRRAFGHGPCHV